MRGLTLGGTAALLSLFFAGCEDPEKLQPPSPAQTIEKAGSSVTNIGCLSGLTSALGMTVRDLHFRSRCSRNPENGKFIWSFALGEEFYSNNDGVDAIEDCIDDLATRLNDHIPYMQISMVERCMKRVKMFNGDRMVWSFSYGKRQ